MASPARHQEHCSCPVPYKSTSTVSDSAWRDIPPLLRTCIFTLKKGFPSLRANRISAFPILRNPIILSRWQTLPSQLEANPTLISQPKLKKNHNPLVCEYLESNREREAEKIQGVDSRTFNTVRVTVLLCLLFSLNVLITRLHLVSQKLPWRLNLPVKTLF